MVPQVVVWRTSRPAGLGETITSLGTVMRLPTRAWVATSATRILTAAWRRKGSETNDKTGTNVWASWASHNRLGAGETAKLYPHIGQLSAPFAKKNSHLGSLQLKLSSGTNGHG